jgi:hypothetical protein
MSTPAVISHNDVDKNMIVFVNGHTFTMPYPNDVVTYDEITSTSLTAYLNENISTYAPSGYGNANTYQFSPVRTETQAFNPHGGYII